MPAWRVHGGGFAGTVQAFVPNEFVEEFRVGMEKLFGQGSCTVMQVREQRRCYGFLTFIFVLYGVIRSRYQKKRFLKLFSGIFV